MGLRLCSNQRRHRPRFLLVRGLGMAIRLRRSWTVCPECKNMRCRLRFCGQSERELARAETATRGRAYYGEKNVLLTKIRPVGRCRWVRELMPDARLQLAPGISCVLACRTDIAGSVSRVFSSDLGRRCGGLGFWRAMGIEDRSWWRWEN